MIPLWKKKEKNKWQMLKQYCVQATTLLAELSKKTGVSNVILVLGQPESGKSVLCASTAHRYIPRASLPGIEVNLYTRDNTAFLEIPKDFFLVGDSALSSPAWKFLGIQLKKLRHHSFTVTHSILCIDLYDLLSRTKKSNEIHWIQIATALNNITVSLGATLKTTLFFTKMDLVPGFHEFFSHQSPEFLQQPWGMTFPDVAHIEKIFDHFLKILNQQLLERLHHTVHSDYLYLIKAFPLAMENVKQSLLASLPTLYQQWRGNARIEPIGLYFISCCQFRPLKENAPHKLFFVQDLLQTLCQAQPTQKLPSVEKIARSTFVLLTGLAFVIFLSVMTHSFSQHIALTQATQRVIHNSQIFLQHQQPLPRLQDISAQLTQLQKKRNTLQQDRRTLLLGRFIFLQDRADVAKLNALYADIVSQQWVPVVSRQLEKFIEENLTTQPEQAYIAVKMYVLLNPARIAPEGHIVPAPYVATHLQALLGNQVIIPKKQRLKNFNAPSSIQYEHLTKWRHYFSTLPLDKLAYIIFFSNIQAAPALNLTPLFHQNPSTLAIEPVFSQIPSIYTRDAFNALYEKELAQTAEEAINGNAVLGKYARSFQGSVEQDMLRQQLKKEYIALYSHVWEDTIKHVKLVQVNTLNEFIDQIDQITSSNSPILGLLNIVQKNTAIPVIEHHSLFLKAFNNTLTPLSTPDNSALFQSFLALKDMSQQLRSLQQDQNANAACALLQQEDATSQHPVPAQQVRVYATQLAAPIRAWLTQYVDAYTAWLSELGGDCPPTKVD